MGEKPADRRLAQAVGREMLARDNASRALGMVLDGTIVDETAP